MSWKLDLNREPSSDLASMLGGTGARGRPKCSSSPELIWRVEKKRGSQLPLAALAKSVQRDSPEDSYGFPEDCRHFLFHLRTNLQIARTAADAAKAAGADVRLLRVAETAPKEVVEGQEAWKANLERMGEIPVVSTDDMVWRTAFSSLHPRVSGLSQVSFARS